MYAHIVDGIVSEISIEQAENCLSVLLDGRTDVAHVGYLYDSAKDLFLVPYKTPCEVPLNDVRTAALEIVEHAARHARHRLYSDPERLSIYTAKFYEAKAYKLKVYGEDLSAYLFIKAEVDATGCTPDDAAATFLAKHSEMMKNLAATERYRIEARKSIVEADSVELVRQAKAEALKNL